MDELAPLLPGLPWAGTPDGLTDADNVEFRRWGQPKQQDFPLRDHIELAELHGMVKFAQAREVAGSRAYALIGNGVLLELAALQIAFNLVVGRGFTPVMPPLMVKAGAMFGTGYFPIGKENAYEVESDGLYLTGTAEVGMVSLLANEVIPFEDMPLKFVGMTTCFRREAGSAGRDTRGLYRVHQFQKV